MFKWYHITIYLGVYATVTGKAFDLVSGQVSGQEIT